MRTDDSTPRRKKRSFPPVAGPGSRVLILGSLPGEASLRLGQYYGHPKNLFWELVGGALGEDLRALPYRRRLARLKSRGIALWDVVAAARRRGSLDSAIRGETHNAVLGLLRRTGARAVFLNGRKAAASFRRACGGPPTGIAVVVLPSSSPANASIPLTRKAATWRRIAAFLSVLLLAPCARARANELGVSELVDRANKALRGDSSRGRLEMTIETPDWKRTLEVEGWNKDRAYAFIVIRAPAKERGETTLRRKTEMWLWMPKVERVIKIPPTMMHSAWQGSDFTYEDIVKADSIVKDYAHALLSKRKEAGRTVYRIESLPRPDAPVVWGKVVSEVAVYDEDQSVVPLLEEDYSERGELIRTITLSDVKILGGRRVPARLECVPVGKKGKRTILRYKELEFDLPLTDAFFSYQRLQKGGA